MDQNITRWALYAAAALANRDLVTGTAFEYELTHWFGPHRSGITSQEIAAKQAAAIADAMMKEVR